PPRGSDRAVVSAGQLARPPLGAICLPEANMADWEPELYNRFRRYRAEPVDMMIARLALGREERIVDLGCGSGENTIELARRAESAVVEGTDSSPAMIERACALRAELGPGLARRVSFALGDMRDVSAEGKYDVVFSNAALQWVSDQSHVLAACYRALKPYGRLAAQVPANQHETAQSTIHAMAAEEPWREWLAAVRTPSDNNVREPAQYAAMLAEIGFAEIDCHYHEFHHAMNSAADVVEFSRATVLRPFLERLPADRRDAFIAALTVRLEKAYGARGPLTFNFRRLFIWGRRIA
ncbi:MAG TPA: methyltransferase domain-containing protein, partial [Candidatus Binataceae bacterium]|nr:methyltransferase domain-containing protein [Candidatus Binataceae bacterium]